MNYEIRKILTQDTLVLRKNILKPFLSEQECVNPGDELSTTFHYGLFHSDQLISVATFILESHPDFPAKLSYRLRGMATDTPFQGQGFGGQLLSYGIAQLEKTGCNFLWFNARIKAFPFYEKLGFQHHGPLFELKAIGPHKVMYKSLIPR